MIATPSIQRNHGKISAGITEIFDTISAVGCRELEAKSDTVQWSVTNIKSPNEGIDTIAAFLVGFRSKKKLISSNSFTTSDKTVSFEVSYLRGRYSTFMESINRLLTKTGGEQPVSR